MNVNPFLGNAEESEHKEQILPAVVADVDQVAMCGQLLEFVETA